MTRSALWVPFVIALLVTGCVGSRTAGPGTLPVPLPIERLTPANRGQTSGLVYPARLVVRDATTLAEQWTRAYGPDVPVPAVDFDRELVIVVAMGEQYTGGYTIEVERVFATQGRLRVEVVSTLPRRGVVTMVGTQPNDVIRVPSRDRVVEFRDRVAVRMGG